jgi:D-glycerate 3-kinase
MTQLPEPAFTPLWPEAPYQRLLQACGVVDAAAWHGRWRQHPDALSIPPDPRWALVLPLLSRCQGEVAKGKRLLIGLNAPVGAGKSSLGAWLSALAPALGLRLSSLSIDDFYWPWQERTSRMAGNPFGVDRVPPGSHDADLLAHQLTSWRQDGVLRWPRFDKRLRQGHGDRNGWSRQEADVVLLEGWLIGCRAIGPAALAGRLERLGGAAALGLTSEEHAWLPHWDAALEPYAPAWAQLDGLWVLQPLDWSWPRRWRFQAETRQRRRSSGVDGGTEVGGAALAGADLERIVRASLCSLPPALYQDPLITDTGCPPSNGVGSGVEAVGLLDGRRRFRWIGTGDEAGIAADQLSSVSALSSIG